MSVSMASQRVFRADAVKGTLRDTLEVARLRGDDAVFWNHFGGSGQRATVAQWRATWANEQTRRAYVCKRCNNVSVTQDGGPLLFVLVVQPRGPVDGSLATDPFLVATDQCMLVAGFAYLFFEASARDKCAALLVKPHKPCDNCGTTSSSAPTKLCGGCRLVRYCSAYCQISNWPSHKAGCRAARRSEPAI